MTNFENENLCIFRIFFGENHDDLRMTYTKTASKTLRISFLQKKIAWASLCMTRQLKYKKIQIEKKERKGERK